MASDELIQPHLNESPVWRGHLSDIAELIRAQAMLGAEGAPDVETIRANITSQYVERHTAEDRERVEVLGKIAARMAQAQLLREELKTLVAQAQSLGISWSDISRAGGITPQAARRRWDATARKKHSDYERNRRKQNTSNDD